MLEYIASNADLAALKQEVEVMKSLVQSCALFCVSVFCITSAAVADNGDPVLENGLISDLHSDGIHKRQNQALEDLINQLRTCRTIISDEQCNSGQIQERVDVYERCNRNNDARLAVNRCQRNSNGDYCNLATTYINEVRSAISLCGTSENDCTAGCRNALLLLRDQVGCCLNLEYNNTISPTFMYSSVFRSSLWSSCNIELITEECSPSTVELPQTQGTVCFNLGLAVDLGMIMCNQNFQEPLLDRLSRADCGIYSQEMIEQCAVDESNQPCYRRAPELLPAFGNVVNRCQTSDLTRCDPRCTDALRNFAQLGGCCINNLYNGSLAGVTSFRYGWFSRQYWEVCGLNSPGFCTGVASPNGATSPSGASSPSGAIIFKASTVFVMIFIIFSLSFIYN